VGSKRSLVQAIVGSGVICCGLLSCSCAMAQTLFQAIVSDPGFGWGSSISTTTDCHGTTTTASIAAKQQWHVDPGLWPTNTSVPLPSLIWKNGSWIPVSATTTTTASDFGVPTTWTASLSSSGTLTIIETAVGTEYSGATPPVPVDVVSAHETRVVQLTSPGNPIATYIWHREYEATTIPPAGSASCPVTTYDPADSVTISMPVDFQLVTAALTLSYFNPFACYVNPLSPCFSGALTTNTTVSANGAVNSPTAFGLAADGYSAVVVAAWTTDVSDPVKFSLQAANSSTPSPFGSLAQYDPNYLASPAATNGTASVTVQPGSQGTSCAPDNSSCYFLALLWAPPNMPVPPTSITTGAFQNVQLMVTATQGTSSLQGQIALEPPPLLLVHGIWSSAEEAWPGSMTGNPIMPSFYTWLTTNYPHNLVFAVNYGPNSAKAFSDPSIQSAFQNTMSSALASAAGEGVAARTVDVVAHSMGGLVTRSFMSSNASSVVGPVHRLITIGTPHAGSPLASELYSNQPSTSTDPAFCWYAHTSPCTLAAVFAGMGKTVDGGVQSLQPSGVFNNLGSNAYSSIVGQAPVSCSAQSGSPCSITGAILNQLITDFIPGQTLAGLLGSPNDTIVPAASQGGADTNPSTIAGIVHTSLCKQLPPLAVSATQCMASDVGETVSPSVWCQALFLLMGNYGPIPSGDMQNCTGSTAAAGTSSSSTAGPLPALNLSSYTQVSPSNASITPTTNSALAIGTPVAITASSPTKTITQVLLLQNVTDPTDAPFYYTTESPFSISYMPTRMGTANFTAIVLFSDMTYATTTLSYTLHPSGSALALTLANAPAQSLAVGSSAIVNAEGAFSTGMVDVTQQATYAARSGTSQVFSVGQGGSITATGLGTDWLDVSYDGVTASAEISVGYCSYSLSPANQLVDYSGGTVSVQVTAPAGCAWTADDGGSSWLSFTNSAGSGGGTVTLTTSPNSTGSTQYANITVAGQEVTLTQPSSACTYSVTPSQISASASATSGNLTVATSCPTIASSNSSWLAAAVLGPGTVAYAIAANTSSSQRTAALTIGTQTIGVTQAGSQSTGAQDFSISASPSSQTISPGQGTSYALTLTPINGFNQSVSLTCAGAPATVTCTPASASVTLNGTGASQVQINVTSTAGSSAFRFPPTPRYRIGVPLIAFLALLSLWPLFTKARLSLRSRSSLVGLALIVALALAGCAGHAGDAGTAGTAAGTYTLTVTTTQGTITHSTTVTLVVQ
jgi:pimeloyl-ACP methyl ester carboxylesterase